MKLDFNIGLAQKQGLSLNSAGPTSNKTSANDKS